MARQIALDTETTGLKVEDGHRIIEIGCLEIIDNKITENHFHAYINPGVEVSPGAYQVHGISTEFLQDKPDFQSVYSQFIDFIKHDELIIHNARFDMGFLNAQIQDIDKPKITNDVIDTLQMARKKFPGSPANLDALCRKYNISLDSRDKHGALIDANLLALVYIAMKGQSQNSLEIHMPDEPSNSNISEFVYRKFDVSKDDASNHNKMLEGIKDPIWNKFN